VSAPDNKAIVKSMWEALAAGDAETFFAALADDVKFTVMGTTSLSLITHGKQEMGEKILGPLAAALDGGMDLKLDNFIAEGGWVVMQSHGFAVGKNGQPYNNHYCQVFRLRGGLVTEWTEYLDTAMLARILDE
jgi:uncharacterized protein